jgi:3-deoxy-D-manno-octulosonate 8-phosphate phosphatase (KDO 8-P phosphatase)
VSEVSNPIRDFSDPSTIELLVLDVDGVLTDGSINIDDDGRETKRFHVRDGYAMKLWMKQGYRLAIITGRSGEALRHRLDSLGVPEEMVIQGSRDKSADLDTILERCAATIDRTACMGDDWPDLPIIERVGYPMCPGDAEPEVRAKCAFITQRDGGHAAVREAIAHLLSVRDRYHPLR